MTKASGKRSAEDRQASKWRPKLVPSRKLSPAENAVWRAATSSWPVDRWTASDVLLLEQYCAVSVWFDEARKDRDPGAMERAGRLLLSYATRLRLTPQSRFDSRAAGRAADQGGDDIGDDRFLGPKAGPRDDD